MSFTLLLIETSSLPIEIMAMKGLLQTCLWLKRIPHIDFLESHEKQETGRRGHAYSSKKSLVLTS